MKVYSNDNEYYYAQNHIYSTVALIDDEGDVLERYQYDAYGKMTRFDPNYSNWSGTPVGNPYYFTGQRLDELDNGSLLIMYYKNRYYLTDIGRFLQPDPLGTQMLYAYDDIEREESPKFHQVYPARLKKGSMNWDELDQVVRRAVRFLDNVIDANYWLIPKIEEASLGNRKIGLGIMGFADCLVYLRIPYDTEKAAGFAAKLMHFIQGAAHDAGEKLARQRGSFPNWKGSVWDTT